MLVVLCIYCMSMMERFAWQSAVSCIRAQAHVGHAISLWRLFGTTLRRVLCGLRFFFEWLFPALVLFLFFCLPLTNHVSINKQQPFHQRVASYIFTHFFFDNNTSNNHFTKCLNKYIFCATCLSGDTLALAMSKAHQIVYLELSQRFRFSLKV